MTPDPRPAPNFLIIGAAKCATTSLASLLEQHPEAGISRPKESHSFHGCPVPGGVGRVPEALHPL